jgi:predicted RNA binding protein with dsRBD fold (UPF0201 family)
MAKVEVSVNVPVRPTEKVDKVVSAIEKIFPGLTMDMRGDRIEAYDGLESLRNLHKLLRDQMILDTARAVMVEGRVGTIIQFSLNKQAAYVGKVNFPFEEEPLGSIHVQITGGDQVIDWLAPETENGVPIREIEISGDEDV